MEGIWGVADVDADEEEDADEGADEDEDMSSSSQSSHASKFEVKGGVPRIIRVSGAGDKIINGTYQLLATTRHVAKLPLPAGLVYVRDGGPLNCRSGGDRLNDVCIFCREGCGHRAWGCIGLVPHHRRRCPIAEGGGSDSMDDSKNDGDVDDVDDDIERRRRRRDRGGGFLSQNFVMEYFTTGWRRTPTTSMESLPAAAVVVLVVVGRSRLWRTQSAEAQPQSVGGGSFGNKGKILEGNPICLRVFAVLVAITHLQSTK